MRREFSHPMTRTTCKKIYLQRLLWSLTLLVTFSTWANWYEASGQAVIEGSDKAHARQQATQEAIKQALLFAGASVSSVQEMANGLLKDDRFEIRSAGEVRKVELVDERYDEGVVTVHIRADIFPQKITCSAADYKKTVVTSWFPVKHRSQAAIGGLHKLGQVLASQLRNELDTQGRYIRINDIYTDYLFVNNINNQQITQLASQQSSQFVLLAEISDLSMQSEESSAILFWQSDKHIRNLGISYSLYDGVTGVKIMHKQLTTRGDWPFKFNSQQDVFSANFWSSNFGKKSTTLLQQLALDLDDALACAPAYGKVLQVNGKQITINMGGQQGVEKGDTLTLLQLGSFYDGAGNTHYQYRLHPQKVKVTRLFSNSAIVESANGKPLGNIQTNDFVARR